TRSEFRTGDRIRLSVMANQNGYLYVIARGASGAWSPLFPNPRSKQGNEVVAGRSYEFPGTNGDTFKFTDQTGDERLFLLLSKTPVANLDKVIANLALQSKQRAEIPASDGETAIPESVMAGIAEAIQSKDLVFDHVGPPPSGSKEQGEKADYV